MGYQLIQIFKLAVKDALWVLGSLVESFLERLHLDSKLSQSGSWFFKFRFIFGFLILSFLSLIAGSTSTMNIVPPSEFHSGHGDPVAEIHHLLANLQTFENNLFSQKNLEIQSKIQNISLSSEKKLRLQLESLEEQSRNQKIELSQIFLRNLSKKAEALGISPEEISLEIDHLFASITTERHSNLDISPVFLSFRSVFRRSPLIVGQFHKLCINKICLVKFQDFMKESYSNGSSIRQDLSYYLNPSTIHKLRHDLIEQSKRPLFQSAERVSRSLFEETFFETYLEFSKERSFFAALSIEVFSRIQKLRENSDMRRTARELERCLDTILENFYSFGFDWEQSLSLKGPHLSFQGFLFGPNPQFARQALDRFHSEPHLLTSLQIESAL